MRLDASGHPEDVAADLIDGWSAVETALRSLVGGSALSGQMLLRELRSRQVITLEQANALAEFHAARDRAQRTDYHPTDADVDAARQGFLRLEAGLAASMLTGETAAPVLPLDRAGVGVAPEVAPLDLSGVQPLPRSGRQPVWLLPLLGLTLLAALGFGFWAWNRSRGGGALAEGVELYRSGQRERAQAAFERAARADPKSALPHVYMSRMAREAGNLTLARSEAQRGIEVDPTNGDAMREMGSVLLTLGDNALAAKFYARAIERDTTDRAAMGWLGCAQMRLGRPDVAQRFFQRAGQGDWTNCARVPVGMPGQLPGQVPPGYPPAGYPQQPVPGQQPVYPQQPPPQGTYIPRSP
jgi:tetratricopeptide (TPR) repeat protein